VPQNTTWTNCHRAPRQQLPERLSLHTELHHRKSTDTIHKMADAERTSPERIAKLRTMVRCCNASWRMKNARLNSSLRVRRVKPA
jgi:hypothetical protein